MDRRLNMPENLGQFTLKATHFGQQCRNVMYANFYTSDTGEPQPFTVSDLQAVGAIIADQYKLAYQSLTHSLVEFNAVDCVGNSNPGIGPLIETSVVPDSWPFGGSEVAEAPANNVSLAIRFKTGLGGRGNHGRFFFIGINSGLYDATDPNRLKAGSILDFATANASFLAGTSMVDAGAGKFSLAVASFVVGGTDRSPAIAHDVTDISLFDAVFDRQGRRLPGRGQ